MVHVKVFQNHPTPVTLLETEEPTVRDAVGEIMLKFNRNTYKGNVHVEIDGKQALYDPWFCTFYKWLDKVGWRQIRNTQWYFTH